MSTSPCRVLIADDHPPTRADLRALLEAEPDFVVCADVPDAPAAVASALQHVPDLAILDIRMPGGGVAAAWEITARLPQTKVVMFTVSRDDDDLFAALRAGASGYLLKDADPAQVAEQLRTVVAGDVAIHSGLVTRLAAEFRDRSPRRRMIVAPPGAPPLTSREWEVLELMRMGATTGQMAERLTVSHATVRSHVAAILRKLRVEDRASAIRLLDANAAEDDVRASRWSDLSAMPRPAHTDA